jgi:hypothetical protein
MHPDDVAQDMSEEEALQRKLGDQKESLEYQMKALGEESRVFFRNIEERRRLIELQMNHHRAMLDTLDSTRDMLNAMLSNSFWENQPKAVNTRQVEETTRAAEMYRGR